MIRLFVILVTCLMAGNAFAASIYLCRAYSGGTFWAKAHCNQHSALIERIVSVPDTLPFDQQVNLAEQQRQSSNSTQTTTNTITNTTNNSLQNRQAECKSLESAVINYDAMARQPQSGQTQDWIADKRKKARDRQFVIKC